MTIGIKISEVLDGTAVFQLLEMAPEIVLGNGPADSNLTTVSLADDLKDLVGGKFELLFQLMKLLLKLSIYLQVCTPAVERESRVGV
jgi:hypothetical protein